MKSIIFTLLNALLFVCFSQPAYAESRALSVGYSSFSSTGTTGATTNATIYKLEFENKVSNLMTFNVGVANLTYKSTIDTSSRHYVEDGNGNSFYVDLNFYPGKTPLTGFYVGPGIGFTPISNNWTDNRYGARTSSSSSANVFDVHGKLGWKINAGKLIVDPNARIGYFLNSPATGGDNLGLYLLIGVNIGVMF